METINLLIPFQAFFSDDRGYLFVRTFEAGEYPDDAIHDIFNPEGVFIGRKGLNISLRSGILGQSSYAKAKNNRLYCLKEKESGYKELVVYKMMWE